MKHPKPRPHGRGFFVFDGTVRAASSSDVVCLWCGIRANRERSSAVRAIRVNSHKIQPVITLWHEGRGGFHDNAPTLSPAVGYTGMVLVLVHAAS